MKVFHCRVTLILYVFIDKCKEGERVERYDDSYLETDIGRIKRQMFSVLGIVVGCWSQVHLKNGIIDRICSLRKGRSARSKE